MLSNKKKVVEAAIKVDCKKGVYRKCFFLNNYNQNTKIAMRKQTYSSNITLAVSRNNKYILIAVIFLNRSNRNFT